jgi:hypothetical protein
MDKVFVDGLVYELENELDRVLTDDTAKRVETPSELLEELLTS